MINKFNSEILLRKLLASRVKDVQPLNRFFFRTYQIESEMQGVVNHFLKYKIININTNILTRFRMV